MKIGVSTDNIGCFRNLVLDNSAHLIYTNDKGKVVAIKESKEEVTENTKMPKSKNNSVFMIISKSVVGEAVRGRRHPTDYGLLGEMEKADGGDLWWLEDYFFFADWAEDHYGQVGTHSSMSQGGAMEQDCPSTSVDSSASMESPFTPKESPSASRRSAKKTVSWENK